MKRYQSHKVVQAAKIIQVSVERSPYGNVCIDLEGGAFRTGRNGIGLFARSLPRAGDYLVIYPDGYESISPRAAFEEGYTEVTDA